MKPENNNDSGRADAEGLAGQPEFLIKTGSNYRNGVFQQETLEVRFPEVHRPVKEKDPVARRLASRLGLRTVEGTGRFIKSRVHVRANSSYSEVVQLEAESVKRHVRRLRPQEAAKLAEVEGILSMLKEATAYAQERKAELVKEAFQKGHVVYVTELREAAERSLAGKGAA